MASSSVEQAAKEAVQTGCLDLSGRTLYEVPPSVFVLGGLQVLDLSGNCLDHLPVAITSLVSLAALDVSYNRLTALPAHLSALTRLQELSAAYNQIRSIAAELGTLAGLTRLLLHDNALASLPPSLSGLCSLEELQLQYNKLSSLPVDLSALTNLSTLELTGNPLPAPLLAASAQGPQAVMQHLSALRPSTSCAAGAGVSGAERAGARGGGGVQVLTLDDDGGDTEYLGSSDAGARDGTSLPSPMHALSPTLPDNRHRHHHHAQQQQGRPGQECEAPLPSPSTQVLRNSFADLQMSYDEDDHVPMTWPAPGPGVFGSDAGDGAAAPAGSGDDDSAPVGSTLMGGTTAALALAELAELPPSAAAVMYRSLSAVQTGLGEIAAGRPLSRCGTASASPADMLAHPSGRPSTSSLYGPPPSSSSYRPMTGSARPGTGSARPGSARPGTSLLGAAGAGIRPGTASSLRGAAGAIGVGASSSGSGRPGSALGGSARGVGGSTPAPLTGALAMLAASGYSIQGTQQAAGPGQRQGSAGGASGLGTCSSSGGGGGGGGAVDEDGDSDMLEQAGAPITFPLASGVRSMLRRAAAGAGKAAAANGGGGGGGGGGASAAAGAGAGGAAGSEGEAAAGVEQDLDRIDTIRRLLQSANPQLLQTLDEALFDHEDEE